MGAVSFESREEVEEGTSRPGSLPQASLIPELSQEATPAECPSG